VTIAPMLNKQTGQITTITKTREESHENDTLCCWEKSAQPATVDVIPWRHIATLSADELALQMQQASVIMLSCTSKCPQVLIRLIEKLAARQDARIYLYGPLSWQRESFFQELLKRRPGSLVIRLGAEPPADWIIADNAGYLFAGAPGQSAAWQIIPPHSVTQTLKQVFTFFFWVRSSLEAIPGASVTGLQPCLAAPFAAPAAPSCLFDRRSAPALMDFAERLVSPDGAPWAGEPSVVLAPYHTSLSLLTKSARSALVWSDVELPRMASSRQRLVISLENGPEHLHVELDGAIDMMHALDDIERRPEWRFYPARRLGDIQGELWLPNAKSSVQAQPRAEFQVGTLQAVQLDEMEALSPKQWKSPTQPSLLWTYEWKVSPPTAPKNAQKASLVNDWQQLDEYLFSQVCRLDGRLREMKSTAESGLLKRLTGLLPFWRNNIEAEQNRIRLALEELGDGPLSQRPESAAEMLSLLEEQHRALAALQSDARRAEDDEERRIDEQSQRSAFEEKLQKKGLLILSLESQLSELQSKSVSLTEQEASQKEELQKLEVELELSIEEGKQAFEQNKAPKKEELQKKLEAQLSLREQKKSELKGLQGKSLKEKNREISGCNDEIGALRKQLEYLDKGAFQPPQPSAALQESRRKLSEKRAEIEGCGRKCSEIERRITQERALCEKPFVFTPTAQAKNPPREEALPRAPRVPTERLPEVGTLVESGAERFLVVSTWEEAARARDVATRLRAKLVAKG
jgi:hypothetical protein